MPKIFTNMPSDELQVKIRTARENIKHKTSRQIRCPYCKRIAFTVFTDSKGYIEIKCEKCKQLILIDLVSMRTINRN